MIVGIGTDLVERGRIGAALDRFGRRFAARVLAPDELARFELAVARAPVPEQAAAALLARRFSQKEAVLKALGTGIGAGIGWHQVEIEHAESGAPRVRLLGQAARRLAELGGDHVLLSTSDERAMAVSFVVITAGSAPPARSGAD